MENKHQNQNKAIKKKRNKRKIEKTTENQNQKHNK